MDENNQYEMAMTKPLPLYKKKVAFKKRKKF